MDTNKQPKKIKPKKQKQVKAGKTKGIPEVGPTKNTVKVFKPTLPSVNMRPNSINIKYEKVDLFKKVLLGMVGVVLLFAGIAGGNIALSFFQENENEQVLDEITALEAQSGSVEPYKVYVDGIELLRSNMSRVMSKDLDMGVILSSVSSAATENNVTITALNLNETLSGIEADNCANSAVNSTTPQVGCIVISGSSGSRDDALRFFESLESNEGIDSGFISEIGSAGAAITFTGNVSIRSNLFSQRNSYLTTDIGEILRSGGIEESEGFESYAPAAGVTLDPQFVSCEDANAAGYGPYRAGVDPEYQWYIEEDPDITGVVCTPPEPIVPDDEGEDTVVEEEIIVEEEVVE